MSTNEYYRMFTDLSRYDPEVAVPVEMLRRFRLGSKKKWCSITTSTHCATYHKFYEVLLQSKDSENMPSESEDEEGKNRGQRRDDKGKGQTFQGPHKTQNFKMSGGSSNSSSRGLSSSSSRGREILVVQVVPVPLYAIDVIIGILGSVEEATVDVLLVVRWVIGLLNALKVSRDPSSLPFHRLHRPSKL
ncbi:hypothetical protein ACFX2K_047009 [Malus domestica]